ncbi:hypothetical protein SAMN05216389_12117 [Oceanobacillus limi]|uniref:Uncharacterized protein n=1 Tax=Oceanobacillus limi TaxID=930131 RepID=A0A1I0GER4_9BACI|nr:hypothetical protein [Oceanobacillus limi]SET69342.1 hypothetical protein SAMN05216389_12117 [Oceanobacillus limi]
MSIPTANEFISMFKNPESEKILEFAKVDPNYVEGDAKVIYDIDVGSGTLSEVTWADHINPTANKSVMIINGVVVAQYDRTN